MSQSLADQITAEFTKTWSVIQFTLLGWGGMLVATILVMASRGLLGNTRQLAVMILLGGTVVQAVVLLCVLVSKYYRAITAGPTLSDMRDDIEHLERKLRDKVEDEDDDERIQQMQHVLDLLESARTAPSSEECLMYLEQADEELDAESDTEFDALNSSS